MNTLNFGDNLRILRNDIKDESVDLIYLDPPFNSNRNYKKLFKVESGAEVAFSVLICGWKRLLMRGAAND